jgi:DnaB helicase-like protein
VSLADELKDELGPDPAKARKSSGQKSSNGESPHALANAIDTMRVLDFFNIEHDDKFATCPGCGEEGALICQNGGIKCLHDRCSNAGPPDFRGFRTNVDISACVRSGDALENALHLCEHFGIQVPARARPMPQDTRGDDPDYVPEPPTDTGGPAAGDSPPDRRAEPAQGRQADKQSAREFYGVVGLRSLLQDVYDLAKSNQKIRGAPTGLLELDDAIGGIRLQHCVVLGAATSFGKTSLALMTQDECVIQNIGVLNIGCEDARTMYARRVTARRVRLNALRLRDNELDPKELEDLELAIRHTPDIPVFLPAIGWSVEKIAKAVRALVPELGLALVIVDYIQRIRAEKRLQDRRNEVTYVTQTLIDAIKESNAGGLLLSQIKRTDQRPTMADLKESGDIENMAEHVCLGHREKVASRPDEPERWRRDITVAKNKDGVVGGDPIEAPFDEVTASFKSTYSAYQRQQQTIFAPRRVPRVNEPDYDARHP